MDRSGMAYIGLCGENFGSFFRDFSFLKVELWVARIFSGDFFVGVSEIGFFNFSE
jgi:hypothetical protein